MHGWYERKTIQLTEEDIVVRYTDGLIEERQQLEDDLIKGLIDSIRHSDLTLPADTLSKQFISEVEKQRLGNIHDDRTVIVLKA